MPNFRCCGTRVFVGAGPNILASDSGVPGNVLGASGPNIAMTVMNKTAYVTLSC